MESQENEAKKPSTKIRSHNLALPCPALSTLDSGPCTLGRRVQPDLPLSSSGPMQGDGRARCPWPAMCRDLARSLPRCLAGYRLAAELAPAPGLEHQAFLGYDGSMSKSMRSRCLSAVPRRSPSLHYHAAGAGLPDQLPAQHSISGCVLTWQTEILGYQVNVSHVRPREQHSIRSHASRCQPPPLTWHQQAPKQTGVTASCGFVTLCWVLQAAAVHRAGDHDVPAMDRHQRRCGCACGTRWLWGLGSSGFSPLDLAL